MIILLIIIGLGSGFVVSGGVFTVLVAVGLVPRFIEKIGCGEKHILGLENSIMLGTVLGAMLEMWGKDNILPSVLSAVMLLLYGLFSGIFVGCLVMAIAEMLSTLPIFAMRLKMHDALEEVIFGISLGKLVGALFYFGRLFT